MGDALRAPTMGNTSWLSQWLSLHGQAVNATPAREGFASYSCDTE
jgi:hypothetical protein